MCAASFLSILSLTTWSIRQPYKIILRWNLSVIAVKQKEKALRHDAMIVSYSCANFVLQHIAE